ncbi:LOW QUALITY PROTEIN: stress-related protein-like [Primulina tabacum]|uniref:LOW QUALITY PROTEIN: stress-related protein-like n=1 Tax=Primulina tabacum TaxID=48773 RepID=UPI003F5A1875
MADSEANSPMDQALVQENYDDAKKLKHLDFVRVAAIYVIICSSTLYEYAKENSGPLKSGVRTVEATVQSVTGPVLEKFQHVPLQFLEFVDRKVDDTLSDLDRNVPVSMKQVSSQAWSAAQKALELARDLASELQRSGVVDTASNVAKTVYTSYEPTTKELYSKYEPLAEKYAVTAWYQLNRLPLFPQAAHVVVPTAAYWAEKYNQAVVYAAERGYTVSYYLPLVPTEKMAKTFGNVANGGQDATISH